jgi:hypothetical protein
MGKSVFSPGNAGYFDRSSMRGDEDLLPQKPKPAPIASASPNPFMFELEVDYEKDDGVLDLTSDDDLADALEKLDRDEGGKANTQRLFTDFAVKLCLKLSKEDRFYLRVALSQGRKVYEVHPRLRKIYADLLRCHAIAKHLGLVMYEV